MLGNRSLLAFIPTTDLDRARTFYADVLGLDVVEETPYAVVVDAGGTTLRLTLVDGLQPQPFTIAGWEVPDIQATIEELARGGVSFVRYGGMEQDQRGVWSTPNGDQVAWFLDPDGNTLSLTTFAT